MFCAHCGMKLTDDTVFCPNCGHKIQTSAGADNIFSYSNQSSYTNNAASPYQNSATITPGTRFCSYCGSIMFPGSDKCSICGKTQKLAGKAYVALTIIAIIILLFTVSSQYQELRDAKYDIAEYLPKAEFLDDYIGIVVKSDGTYYHRYGCSKIADQSFSAYNINKATALGYIPCPLCH